jgi:hypothetical protein
VDYSHQFSDGSSHHTIENMYIYYKTLLCNIMVQAILQLYNYEAKKMEGYAPEFIDEMQKIISGDHVSIPDGLSLADFINSLPDEENDE